jgi:hypothetical protein
MASLDDLFREALEAVDQGDLEGLSRKLDEHPELACERLEKPGSWLTEKLGPAIAEGGFFERPYLLWFLSEDAVRAGRLPSNVAQMAELVIDRAKRGCQDRLQEQLDFGLRLVAWSGVAARSGVQLKLLDVLIGAGASTKGVSNDALVNGHEEAAAYLVSRGAELTLPTALCLGRFNEARQLAERASEAKIQFAFVLSALNGKAEALRLMLPYVNDINTPSEHLYSHGAPLHHAVCSGNLDAVAVLVEAGANLGAVDSIHGGTPLGWAEYYVSEGSDVDRRPQYAVIADCLRGRMVPA